MPKILRSVLFSMVLGFHNALEQDDASLEDLRPAMRVHLPDHGASLLARPERCFFWGSSSLAN